MATKFAAACFKFFGKKPADQTLQDFAKEVKQLTPQDKADLLPELELQFGEKIED